MIVLAMILPLLSRTIFYLIIIFGTKFLFCLKRRFGLLRLSKETASLNT